MRALDTLGGLTESIFYISTDMHPESYIWGIFRYLTAYGCTLSKMVEILKP